ncbi:ABC transporter permease [Pseudoflavitalea sp. X16]|uniref:ABC transporter permease n=1 Tax=Paraflavitalea devenefica TaxID=2716334 RepID=UPI001420E9EF|nr:ABC transporter permease [Paraflavitalea devenefica]NII29569.1 ABC transporter permease [Paraflavitalea devenefica]
MRRVFEILGSSLNLTWQEFKSHKIRTLLSLSGVAFGIFCIIGVLAAVNSLEYAVQKDIKALGSNTVYIDKWEYADGGNDYPWWKYVKRPDPAYEEMVMLKKRVPAAANVAFNISTSGSLELDDNTVSGVNYYGITEEFSNIQPIDIQLGRYLQQSDFDYGSNVFVIGYEVAVNLFGNAEKAVGKTVKMKAGKRGLIVGLIKKQGKSIVGGWEYDNSILMPLGFMKEMVREKYSNPIIMVQGKETVPMEQLKDELTGAMRSVRKLKPTQENDFSLNDIDAFSSFASGIFSNINKGGWAIAALSLVVGMFGVANIMFVTVRERTSQIGLKKAIGAKSSTILTEFLLESAFLCIMGGLLGLSGVFMLTLLSTAAGFPVFIAADILLLAISICIVVGVLAGIIPASIAARMNPVEAIRSK